MLVSQAGSSACDIHKTIRRAALAGVLRCSLRQAVGIYPQPKTTSGNAWGFEASSQKLSCMSAYSSDTGQLLAAPQGCRETVLPAEQYSFDLDADERVMAQSDRMSVYAGEGVCLS